MGLLKEKLIKGHSNNYWRIIQINCNADRKDAVATFALYKDKATRDEDANAVVSQYQVDLGADFNNKVLSDDTKIGDKVKKSAYEVLKSKAVTESEKEEEIDESLAFFADAEDELTEK